VPHARRCPMSKSMTRRASNQDVIRALREMSKFLEMRGVAFKPQAYEKAAYAVTALERPITEILESGGPKALEEIPGVGAGMARRIAELVEKGAMKDLEDLRKETPVDVLELTAIEGVGPKRVLALWEALHVRTLADLREAAQAGR